jgi:hypothetical protein
MFTQMSRFRPQHQVRSQSPLTHDQIRRVAPSVFAAEAHDSRSSRYAYIPTSDILTGLRAQGFEVFSAAQARCRSEERRDHTKHLLRLRHVGEAGKVMKLNDSQTEICLLNSHDGSSSYQMFAGVFRLVCLNGMMVCDSTVGAVKVPHTGKVQDRVIEGAYEILDGCTRIVESQETMRALTLDRAEADLFAKAAITIRYDDGAQHAPIEAEQLLRARRSADDTPDLWATFNRVQENMIKGGLRGRNASNRPTTTREIQGIDQNVKVNKALWQLAEGMAALKAGKA